MDSIRPGAWSDLGAQLIARRRELGYGDFGRRADFHRDRVGSRFSYRTLTRLEKGERDYYPDETLAAVAEIYEVTPQSVRAVISGTGDLVPSGSGPAVPKMSLSGRGRVNAPAESPVMLPKIVADHLDTPGVLSAWSITEAGPEERLDFIRKILGLPPADPESGTAEG